MPSPKRKASPPVSLGRFFKISPKPAWSGRRAGSGGGFALVKTAEEITVLAVIEAIEGKIAFQRCLEEKPDCTHMGGCALCGLFSEAQDRVKEVFGRTTIASLSKKHTSFADHQAEHGLTGPKHQPGKPQPRSLLKLSRIPQPI